MPEITNDASKRQIRNAKALLYYHNNKPAIKARLASMTVEQRAARCAVACSYRVANRDSIRAQRKRRRELNLDAFRLRDAQYKRVQRALAKVSTVTVLDPPHPVVDLISVEF